MYFAMLILLTFCLFMTCHWFIEYSLFGVYLFTVCVFIYCFFHVLVSYLLIYRFRHFFAMLYLVLFFSWNRSIHWFCFFKRLYVGEKITQTQIRLMPSVMAKINKQYRNYKHGELLFAFVLMLYLYVQFSTKMKLFPPNPPLFCVSVNHENFHDPRQNWIFLRSVILFLRVRQ